MQQSGRLPSSNRSPIRLENWGIRLWYWGSPSPGPWSRTSTGRIYQQKAVVRWKELLSDWKGVSWNHLGDGEVWTILVWGYISFGDWASTYRSFGIQPKTDALDIEVAEVWLLYSCHSRQRQRWSRLLESDCLSCLSHSIEWLVTGNVEYKTSRFDLKGGSLKTLEFNRWSLMVLEQNWEFCLKGGVLSRP